MPGSPFREGAGGRLYYGCRGALPVDQINGFADLVRTASLRDLLASERYMGLDADRRRCVHDHLAWAEHYFEMRRIDTYFRTPPYERGLEFLKSSMDDLSAKSNEDFIRLPQVTTKRLSSSQLDPITGSLAWPRLLLTPRFAAFRGEVNHLFAERAAKKGDIGHDGYRLIVDRVATLLSSVREVINYVPPQDYIDASKFLESLAYEARFVGE